MKRAGPRAPLLLFAAILVVAALVRVLDYPTVLGLGEELAYSSDGDTAYHLYRTREAVARFPHVPVFDPWVNWPRGAPCQWSSGYDVLAAAWVRAWGGGDDLRGHVLTMLFPIACGIVLVAATVELARRIVPPRSRAPVALAAGLLVALNPAAVFASCFGRTDHHGVEALSVVLLACWAVVAARSRASRQRGIALWGALVVAFALWVFSGGPLYVAIATLSLGLVALLQRAPRVGWGAPAGLALGGGVAAASYGPALAAHGQLLTFKYPSLLQPGLCVVAAALLAWAIATSTRIASRGARLGWFTLGALALAALAAATPGLSAQLREGLGGWVLHRDPWLATIGEFQPLFSPQPPFRSAVGSGLMIFGAAGVAAIALVPVAIAIVRRFSAMAALVFGTHAIALLALTLVQVRFARVAAPFAAVVVAIVLGGALHLVARTCRTRRQLLAGAAPLAAVALLAADPAVRRELVVPRGEIDPVQATALALRPAGAVRPGERAGVLAHWSLGNFMRVIGRRPVVVTGFGTYIDEAAFWEVDRVFSRDEAALTELMDRRDLGYLVAGPFVFGSAARQARASPFVRGELGQEFFDRFPLAPLLIAGSGISESGVRHLEHFLPVYATQKTVAGLSLKLPMIWSYERVSGARLVGTAPPSARIEGRLVIRAWGRPFVWQAWTDADPAGRWEMRVPVPSGYAAAAITSDPRWTVSAGHGAPVSIAVSEDAVRRGGAVLVGAISGGG
jgi:asparagine N-glycosylation enzyme membrane subunit Stt3